MTESGRRSNVLGGGQRVSHPGEAPLLGSVARLSVEGAATPVHWLIDYLKARDIEAPVGSPLESAALRTWEVAELHRARGEH